VAFGLLTGTFESTLDEKGRIGIPARLRERYTGDLVITQGRHSCVWIMTRPVYEQFIATLEESASALSYEEYTAFQYQHVAPAQEAEIDSKSGRIQVPQAIRSYARLSRECLVVSIDEHLEIWDADMYRAHMQEIQRMTQEAVRKLGSVRFFGKRGGQA
jgi:MraZ protein